MARPIFELDPKLDPTSAKLAFARDGRAQLRDVLTLETAREIRRILAGATPWGIAWQAGTSGPQAIEAKALAGAEGAAAQLAVTQATDRSAAAGEYACRFGRYPILDAYLGRWAPGGPHDLLLEYLNTAPFLDLVRTVSGLPQLIKADAQATFYAPGHFLGTHSDSHVREGWLVAYVLNFAPEEWRPEWGGMLEFYDDDGDVVTGWRPRFNALNLFLVPQPHGVSFVPPFAPLGRYAITGWLRDR